MKLNYIPYIPCLIESLSSCGHLIHPIKIFNLVFFKSLSVKGKITGNSFPRDRYPASLDCLHILLFGWLLLGVSLPLYL